MGFVNVGSIDGFNIIRGKLREFRCKEAFLEDRQSFCSGLASLFHLLSPCFLLDRHRGKAPSAENSRATAARSAPCPLVRLLLVQLPGRS